MDINMFRKDNPLKITELKESQRRRGRAAEDIDEVTRLDEQWRLRRHELDLLNAEINEGQKLIQKETDNEKKAALIARGKELKVNLPIKKEEVAKALLDRDEKLYAIGNMVHDSVPVSIHEKDNAVVKTWGKCRPNNGGLKHHHELLWMIGGYQPEIGAEVAGHRGYYLTGPGMLLNNALVQYGLQFLASKKYTPVQTPFFMKQSAMKKVAALAEFNESLYKVTGDEGDEPMYLIATSEQPICALNMNQSFSKKDLPVKYAGFSTCFRKEAGKHGKDAWGVFRVHQFEKIEQFVVCHPDESYAMQEEMIRISEEFYESLDLAYQVVNIVSGELNNAAAKKLDLEAWFPTLSCYRELVSCSNCTDYQARRLNIRFNTKTVDNSTCFVHLLNSTLCATERTLCCLLENYQTEKGIRIPDALKPFLAPFTAGYEDPNVIPFIRNAPLIGKGGKGAAKKEREIKAKNANAETLIQPKTQENKEEVLITNNNTKEEEKK